jgi:uncharacterized membrane protein
VNGAPSSSRSGAGGGSSTTGLDPTVASALAYLAGPLSGLLVLAAERSNTDVRFHAWQSIVGLGALWAIGFLLYVLAFTALFVSATGFLVLLWLAVLAWAGWIVLWVMCLLKAFRGERWKLPLVGDYAERKAQLRTSNS